MKETFYKSSILYEKIGNVNNTFYLVLKINGIFAKKIMNTDSREFWYALYTVIVIHVIIGTIILYRRYRKKK